MKATSTPLRARTRLAVAALAAFVLAVIAAWFFLAERDGSSTAGRPPVEPVDVSPSSTAELSTPLHGPRAVLESPEPQAPAAAAALADAKNRLHGIVRFAPGRTEFVDALAVVAADALGNEERTFCSASQTYVFEDLEPGRYWLSVRSPNNERASTTVDVQGDTRHDIQLESYSVVTVRAVDELGKPLAILGLFAVATLDEPGDWIEEARIGSSNPIACGRFEHAHPWRLEPPTETLGRVFLDRVPPLHVSLMRYQRVLATQRVEAGTELVEFVLRSDDPALRNGGIRMRIVDSLSKEPLPKVAVMADGEAPRMQQSLDGICAFDDMPPGTYRLQFMTRDHAMERIEVLVPPGEIVDLGDVELRASHSVSGRILDETGKGSVLDIRFDPCEADGRIGPLYGQIFAFPTKPDGSFRVSGLAPGFHRLEVMGHRELAECVAVFDVRQGPVENATLTVTAGIPFVVDPNGHHGPGARFVVIDEKGVRVVSRSLPEPAPIRVRLAPGRYTVEFQSSRDDPEPRTAAFEIVRDPVVVRMR